MRGRILDRLMADGVTVLDPASTYVDDTVQIGADTVLYPGVTLEGHTVIGAECTVGPGSCVSASRLGDRVTLRPYCVLNEAVVDDDAALGPFCHLRPASHVGAKAKIGNFVELKKSKIGRGRQGAASLLCRRRHGGRRREHRRGRHHVQLRRREQARDDRSARAPSSARTRASSRPSRWETGRTWAPAR